MQFQEEGEKCVSRHAGYVSCIHVGRVLAALCVQALPVSTASDASWWSAWQERMRRLSSEEELVCCGWEAVARLEWEVARQLLSAKQRLCALVNTEQLSALAFCISQACEAETLQRRRENPRNAPCRLS